MFGGIDDRDLQTDDFYWIAPDVKANSKNINNKNGEFKGGHSKPEMKLIAKRIYPEGRGPIARAQHAATFFKN